MKKKSAKKLEAIPLTTAAEESLNRSAFLLGLYVELPAVDSIVEPLVKLSVMLSIPKLTLLDHSIARLGEYDVERSQFPPRGSIEWGNLDASYQSRSRAVSFLYNREHEKIRTIAGLLWEGQTEPAAWYHAGRAIGAVVNMCDNDRGVLTADAVTHANLCLGRAASSWGAQFQPESGYGLANWLSQWGDRVRASEALELKTNRKSLKPECVRPAEPREKSPQDLELRAVEALAVQIQDRPEETRSYEQRNRDERDQFIYEKFFARFDASEIYQLLEKEIKEKHRPWKRIPQGSDLRSIANQYAIRLHKPAIPPGTPGRPPSKNRK